MLANTCMQILLCWRNESLSYQKIKAHDKNITISINIVSCRRETRAYHASLNLVGTTNRNASYRILYITREDGSLRKWASSNNIGFYCLNENIILQARSYNKNKSEFLFLVLIILIFLKIILYFLNKEIIIINIFVQRANF